MRFVGLDVHRDFCEVAIVEQGRMCSAGRVQTTPEALTLFGQSPGPHAQVVLEATANALAIARLLRPHVARVVLTEPSAVHDLYGAKTDKIDARALARLLAGGFVGEVWAPDDETAALRRQLSRRRQLVKQRTREKNQVHAVLMRNLRPRPPMSDLFGVKGRGWLAEQQLPEHERAMVDACLRHLDFLEHELALLDGDVARRVRASEQMLRLLQLPGGQSPTGARAGSAPDSRPDGALLGSARCHRSPPSALPQSSRWDRRTQHRSAARLLAAHRRSPRREHRDDRGRAQARPPGICSASARTTSLFTAR